MDQRKKLSSLIYLPQSNTSGRTINLSNLESFVEKEEDKELKNLPLMRP
jgi:hypothetical protein